MRQFLLVDGYNVINAWSELKEIAKINLEEARDRLIQEMVDYKHYTGYAVIVVFDAHYVKGNDLRKFSIKGVEVIFTKEHQTADSYIEKMVEELTKDRRNFVTVATSDWAEQQVVLGSGGTRISARELKLELERIMKKIHKKTEASKQIRSTLRDRIDKQIVEKLEKWRRNQ
ncbi:NYN domain-containing protein [Crassaminicella thermophila]|uniref:NYN domain-containing protein n=1 Tax=Crassaminicella thermophila TaxID=2599308 RepID=A0A5C0SAT7_CRATE|nr:NYN domain-containing protein [Crassaminicella thermophila]QEK11150.1 NYN domain-containing protein [Crassaminicella thermophila]